MCSPVGHGEKVAFAGLLRQGGLAGPGGAGENTLGGGGLGEGEGGMPEAGTAEGRKVAVVVGAEVAAGVRVGG